MSKRENSYSLHHVIPRSRAGATNEENLLELRNTTHRAIHTLFANQLLAEQLITTVNLSEKALRPEIRAWLLETLTAHDPEDLDFRYKDKTHFLYAGMDKNLVSKVVCRYNQNKKADFQALIPFP